MNDGGIPVNAVVFDLDGTLVDTMPTAPQAYVDTIRALGGPVVGPADVVATWHIGATPAVLAHFLNRPVTPADLECYHQHADAASAKARRFPGVRLMLDMVRGRGHRLAVYTSASLRVATHVLAGTRLDAYFPVVICGDQVDEPKPAAEGLVRVCERLGIAPADTAYVGDAATDLACAAAAGALGIHATWSGVGPLLGQHLTAAHPREIPQLIRTNAAS